MSWWILRVFRSVVVFRFVAAPGWLGTPLIAVLFALACVRARGEPDRAPEVVAAPVRGRWTALTSPGTKVPSHGIRAYGQSHAIDIPHPRPPEAPPTVGWGIAIGRAQWGEKVCDSA